MRSRAAAGKARISAEDIESKRTGGPYVPTPQVVVDEMLRIGKVGASDFVVDLGSGDGVIVLTAATKFKSRGFGVASTPSWSSSPLPSEETGRGGARLVLRAGRLQGRHQQGDRAHALPVAGHDDDLRPKIFGELNPGTRVVSHDYHFGDWQADDQYTWDVPEKEKINGVPRATVYLWIIPAKVAGRWQLSVSAPANEKYDLTLRQNFQSLDGTVTGNGAKAGKLTQSRLAADEISFAFTVGGDRHLFRGRIAGETMEGTVQLAGGKGSAKWTAVRLKA